MVSKFKAGAGYALFLAAGLGLGYVGSHLPGWLKPAYQTGDYTAFYPNKQLKVAVYGTGWCPFCKKARTYLQSKQVAFSDVNIEADKQTAEQFKRLGGGGAIPVILIGDRRIEGFVPDQIDAALKQLH